jgi:hypothetical protein
MHAMESFATLDGWTAMDRLDHAAERKKANVDGQTHRNTADSLDTIRADRHTDEESFVYSLDILLISIHPSLDTTSTARRRGKR